MILSLEFLIQLNYKNDECECGWGGSKDIL